MGWFDRFIGVFVSYGLFANGFPAYASYVVFIVIYAILIFVKLHIIRELINFPVRMFYKETLYRIIPVTFSTFVMATLPFCSLGESFMRLVLTCAVALSALAGSVYFLGLEASERMLVNNKLALIYNKIFNK